MGWDGGGDPLVAISCACSHKLCPNHAHQWMERMVRGIDQIVTSGRNHELECKRARRIDGGPMVEAEASGGYVTNG